MLFGPLRPALNTRVPETVPELEMLKFVLVTVAGSKGWLNSTTTAVFKLTPVSAPFAGLTDNTLGCGAVYPVAPLNDIDFSPTNPVTCPASSTSTT